MTLKITLAFIFFTIGVLIDAYLIERYLLQLKKHNKTFTLHYKNLIWGFVGKTHLTNVSGLALIPIFIQIIDPIWDQSELYISIPIILILVFLLKLIGSGIQYLLFRFYLKQDNFKVLNNSK
jgi:hypothetical protein